MRKTLSAQLRPLRTEWSPGFWSTCSTYLRCFLNMLCKAHKWNAGSSRPHTLTETAIVN